MKLYISECSCDIKRLFRDFDICNNILEASDVLILPGGLGTNYDLFYAIKLKKNIYLYNEDLFFKDLINYLYENKYIEEAPFKYINIESSLEDIIKKIKER